MRCFFLILMMGSLMSLSACKDNDDSSSKPEPPKPEPTCKVHCAP
jgi:hypothetical protein